MNVLLLLLEAGCQRVKCKIQITSRYLEIYTWYSFIAMVSILSLAVVIDNWMPNAFLGCGEASSLLPHHVIYTNFWCQRGINRRGMVIKSQRQ